MLPGTHSSLMNPLIVSNSAAIFAFIYAIFGLDPSGLVALYIQYGPTWSIICWAVADSRGTELARTHDLGLFYFVGFPVAFPGYLAYRYKKRAWPLAGLFIGILLSPTIGHVIGMIVRMFFVEGAA